MTGRGGGEWGFYANSVENPGDTRERGRRKQRVCRSTVPSRLYIIIPTVLLPPPVVCKSEQIGRRWQRWRRYSKLLNYQIYRLPSLNPILSVLLPLPSDRCKRYTERTIREKFYARSASVDWIDTPPDVFARIYTVYVKHNPFGSKLFLNYYLPTACT